MKKIIIYIEDNPAEQMIMKYAFSELSNSEWELICFASGEDFIDFIKVKGQYSKREKLTGKFLILLDINLGRIDGFEVLKLLKTTQEQKFAGLSVMMLSSSRRESDIQLADQLGAKGFITKPLDYYEVKNIIQDLLTKHVPEQETLSL